jgi:hypothetical protein
MSTDEDRMEIMVQSGLEAEIGRMERLEDWKD